MARSCDDGCQVVFGVVEAGEVDLGAGCIRVFELGVDVGDVLVDRRLGQARIVRLNLADVVELLLVVLKRLGPLLLIG